MDETIALEKQRARAIAEEYRSRSYEVIEGPSPEQLPDFLSGYQPDLIMRRGDDAVVVEVKTRSSLAKDPQVRDLAQLLQGKPGWSFELVVVSEGEKLSVPEGTRSFAREEIIQNAVSAERLVDAGFSEAGLLLAWAAVEAAVRMLTENEGIVLDRMSPPYVVNQAVAHGVISRDEYNLLTNAVQYRNALVHGFKITDFDPALVEELIRTTKRILQSA